MEAFGRGRRTRHGRSHSEPICERDSQTDAGKTQRSDRTPKREIGSWGTTRKRTIYCDVKNDASLKQQRRDDDAGTHSNDLHKQGIRDGNKETGGWAASIENLSSNPWEPDRDANVDKETCGWGSLEPDDRTKEADAWSAPENDLQKQGIKDGNKETDGWGASIEKLGSNPWEPNRDANIIKETGGWGSLEPNDRTKEVDAWSAPELKDRDGIVNRKTVGWNGGPKNDGVDDPWERRSYDDTVTKKTDGWGAAIDPGRSFGWGRHKTHNNVGNAEREPDGWNKSDRDANASAWGAMELNDRNGIVNKKTVGWNVASKKDDSDDPWERRSYNDIVTKKTNGWGTTINPSRSSSAWGATIDLGRSSGWGCHNNIGNAEREADGWNKSDRDANANANAWGAPERNDRDGIANKKTNSDNPWERRSYDDTVTKKTDGWGTVINPGHSSVWGRQNNNDNAEREADGWNKSDRNNGPRPPIGIKSATNSWDKRESVGVCRNFIAGRCTRDSQCRYLHDDNKKARGVCYRFEKGRCHKGSACCYVHHENIDCRTRRSQSWNKNSSWNAPKSPDTSNKNSSSNGPKWADVATGTEPFGLVEMRVDLIKTPNKADVTNDTEPSELMETINAPRGSATNPIDLEEGHQLRILKSSTTALSVTGHADENPTKNPEPVQAKQTGTGEVSGAGSDVVRRFKFALVDYVKEKLKPNWDDGDFSKDIHKVIVKKVVDKVIGALQGSNIPRTQDHIDIYLSFAEAKLNNLIQAYLKKYTGKAIKVN